MFIQFLSKEVENMFPVPPVIDKGTQKGSGLGRIVIVNDNLRAKPQQ